MVKHGENAIYPSQSLKMFNVSKLNIIRNVRQKDFCTLTFKAPEISTPPNRLRLSVVVNYMIGMLHDIKWLRTDENLNIS